MAYFKLCCGQAEVRMRSARGSYMKLPPQIVDSRAPRWAMGAAHWDPKAIRPFVLPGAKKRRLFEDILARSSCALERQGKWAADGPVPNPSSAGGGIMPFSCFVVSAETCGGG